MGVFIELPVTKKNKPFWKTPFKVHQVDDKRNTIIIKDANKIRMLSVKNVRRKAGCGKPHFHFSRNRKNINMKSQKEM